MRTWEIMEEEKLLFIDLEANGLLYDATKIHCINYNTGDSVGYSAINRHDGWDSGFKRILKKSDVIIGHNISGFDIPLLEKLLDIKIMGEKKVFDTMLGSYLLHPDKVKHSIEYYGELFGEDYKKIPITDWSKYTSEMGARCCIDVKVTKRIYEEQKDTWLTKKEHVMDLECWVAYIQAQQELYGVRFDVSKACDLLKILDTKSEWLRQQITEGVPPNIKPGTAVLKPWTKSGRLSKRVTDWFKGYSVDIEEGDRRILTYITVKGPFSKLTVNPFNLDSPKQVTDYLLSIGWKPTAWNFTTDKFGRKKKSSPKLTEESYDSLPEGLGKMIGEYKIVEHRRRFLLNRKDPTKGALATVRPDGRVPARALTCATPTSRYRHTETVCNIPRPSTPYGPEIRSLFCVPDGRWMVGNDLKGIEARLLVHYCLSYPGGEELRDIVLDGDFHQHNADAWDTSRDLAKNGFYALVYGCKEAKLASTLKKPKKEGKKLMKAFWDANPAIRHLIDALELAYKTGRVIHAIDGRPIYMDDIRKLLNRLLQTSAAVVFKHWMVKNHRWKFVAARQIIAYHDELQYESFARKTDGKSYAENIVGKYCNNHAKEVGKELKIKVPIESEWKIGRNWSETH